MEAGKSLFWECPALGGNNFPFWHLGSHPHLRVTGKGLPTAQTKSCLRLHPKGSAEKHWRNTTNGGGLLAGWPLTWFLLENEPKYHFYGKLHYRFSQVTKLTVEWFFSWLKCFFMWDQDFPSWWWTEKPGVHGVAKSWTWRSNWNELNWTKGFSTWAGILHQIILWRASLATQG